MVEMAQDLARRLRVQPSSLDCLMINPTPDELMRFKQLAGVPTHAMQSRFAVVKVRVNVWGGTGCGGGCGVVVVARIMTLCSQLHCCAWRRMRSVATLVV